MISAWDVYWVMQLDSIRDFFIVGGFCSLFVSCVVYVILWSCLEDGKTAKVFWAVPLSLGFMFVGSFIPSSKTAAAMIILPAVTSEEAVNMVKPEAKELYELTKDALRSMITEKTTKEVEK